ncbi:hypothetical protein [Luethyella okanaganae]|uniref:WxL domain-containing protein n=1 Tax=Luethyella okanaganae TaxID=69372 RepID=A0ABW1VFJ8_9MICO
MSLKKTTRVTALAVTGALLTAGLSSVATAAYAGPEQIIPGTITIAPTSGTADLNPMFTAFDINAGCPVGFREGSHTVAYQNGLNVGSLSKKFTTATISAYGDGGLTGNPVHLEPGSDYISATSLDTAIGGAVTIANGDFEIRRYCWADPNVFNAGTDKYFVLPMTFTAATNTWAVKTAAPVEVPVFASFTVVGNSNGTVSAAAHLTGGNGPIAGKVEFLQGGTKVGEGVVNATGDASWASGVTPAGTYSYTAKFVTSDAAKYSDSPETAPVSLVHSGSSALYQGTPADVNILVEVPTTIENNGLKLTVPATPANLGAAANVGGKYTASGKLGEVTVTDSRQNKAGWNLTGVNSLFTNQSNPAKTISAGALGWTPEIVNTQDAATAGATVAPDGTATVTGAGLSVTRPLSSASANATVGTIATTTNANLAFSVPADGSVAPGTYGSKLTLTLI